MFPKQSPDEFLKDLTDEVLRDLARNDSATPLMRKEATRLLISRRSPHAKHEDLRDIVTDLNKESEAHQEVVAIVESATEAPFPTPIFAVPPPPPTDPGPSQLPSDNPALKASFTTSSM